MKVLSKCICLCLCICLHRCFFLFLVRSCLLITLIKCLKGDKSLGSLCSLVKALIVSLVRQTEQATKGQGHLLSCSGQLKMKIKIILGGSIKKREKSSLLKIGADTQRKEHQAQSDGMSNIYLSDRKCNSYKRRFSNVKSYISWHPIEYQCYLCL